MGAWAAHRGLPNFRGRLKRRADLVPAGTYLESGVVSETPVWYRLEPAWDQVPTRFGKEVLSEMLICCRLEPVWNQVPARFCEEALGETLIWYRLEPVWNQVPTLF